MPLQSQLVSVVLFLAIASQLNLNCYAAAKGSNQASKCSILHTPLYPISKSLPLTLGKKCQQYGHSCLGGHGKRSSPSSSSASSSMPIPAFFSSSSSRVLPARSYSAGSGSGSSPLSSTEQLYFGGSPSSRPLSSSHFLSSSNNNKLPLVYTLLSAAFPSRKHQQLQQQQPNWKSFQESSAVSSETVPESWAAAQAEQAEQYLVPLPPPVNGAPTDPDGGDLLQIREGLGSNFFSSGNGNFHRVANAHQPSFFQKEAETGKQQQGSSDWELPSPMKKAAGALLRFRRSLIAGGKVGATVGKGVGH